MDCIQVLLEQARDALQGKFGAEQAAALLARLGVALTADELRSFRLWGDYLPLAKDNPYTEEQRMLHITWELLDRTPWGINCAFAIPFRQLLAKKLFRHCGEGFVCAEGCRFNYGHQIEVGDNVSWNMGCFVDAKGGVTFEDFAMMTEYVKIFTHGHSEADHALRTYTPVKIERFAKLYTNSTVLPGVTVHTGGIVATGSIVTKDVEAYTLVSGIPARPMRPRKTISEDPEVYNQYMLDDRLFQVKKPQ